MKNTFTKLIMGCVASVMALALFVAAVPTVTAQPADEVYSIPFIGLQADHEGAAGWNADGTGPEPAATGHWIPFPGYGYQFYYSASVDYGDIDPDPYASGGHFTEGVTGFPLFMQALADHDYLIEQMTVKYGYSTLGEDIEGQDWFVIENWLHSIYYDNPFFIYLDGNLILEGVLAFSDMNIVNGPNAEWQCETGYIKLDSAWIDAENEHVKEMGRAFLADLDGQEIRVFFTEITSASSFDDNGRIGSKFDVAGYIEKGLPELPYIGLAADHQGMAGWNADGTGPEPAGDGHGAQRYYIGSRDYGNIDPDPDAAFGHFMPEMKGFLNFELQMAYRGYDAEDMVIKQGLASLGNDIMGLDWGFENGTDYWCNYYDLDYKLQLNGEDIIKGMIDTSHSMMNANPVYWLSGATYDRPRDNSVLSSEDANIIAAAFLKDLESRKLLNEVQVMTYDTATFEGNGRYDGGYFNVETARLVGIHADCGTFVQCDSLCSGFTDHTNWTLAHSPYLIDNDLVIEEGHTLNIQPGVKVAVRGPYKLKVDGQVLASGSKEEGITFTSSNPNQRWNSFVFDATPDERQTKFEFCTFEYANSTKYVPFNSGGAVSIVDFSNILFSNCTFRYNQVNKYMVPAGGAIALSNASPVISHCTFYENKAKYGGAIMCMSNSNPVIEYSLFYGNQASTDGGAIEVYEYSTPVFTNNTITGNIAGRRGGGLDIYHSSNITVHFVNNIIHGNTCSDTIGHQVSLSSESNHLDFKFNDIQFGLADIGPGAHTYITFDATNIDNDPFFCWDENANPYTIGDCSPCLDQGEGGMYIGAFDWGCVCTDIAEKNSFNEGLIFYPSPAQSGSLSVSFFMENPGQARLEIYNMTGEKTGEPVNGFYASGEHQCTISIEGLPAGIYFGRLTAGNRSFTTKFTKIR